MSLTNNCTEAVRLAANYGFAVFPVAKNKAPLTPNGFKDASSDTTTINRMFAKQPTANIGIATGKASGVTVIDEDIIGSLTKFANGRQLPQTPTVSTSKGKHFYFAHEPCHDSLKNAVRFAEGLDVRATGGYVVGPTSDHVSGHVYEWLVSPKGCEFAKMPDWLYDAIPKRDDQQPKKEVVKPKPKPKPKADTFIVTDGDIGRAKAYLAECPPAIEGEGGHNTTFFTVCRLVEQFDLDDDETLEALDDWNDTCQPPWSHKELRHKVNEARKKVARKQHEAATSKVSDAAYYGILGDIVKAIEPETEADSVGVLLSLLVACGHATGKGPSFRVGGDEHHANLFVCLVGDTASGKGQAWGVADWLLSRVDSEWQTGLAYGLSSGEGLIERVADEVPEDMNTILVIPPKRILCVETEFGRVFTAMRREGNTLSPILRCAWDCKPLETITRGKTALRATNAFISLITHVTPGELETLLAKGTETTNGFANKFLWANVQSSKDLPSGGNIAVLEPFIEPLKKALENAKAVTTMQRDADCERAWESVYVTLKHSGIKVTERARPQVMRLAMIYTALDGSPYMLLPHLRAALAVWWYCDASARAVFGAKPDTALEARIIELLDANAMTKTELRNAISGTLPATELDKALACLTNLRDIEPRQEWVGSKSVTRYVRAVRGQNGHFGQNGHAAPNHNDQNDQRVANHNDQNDHAAPLTKEQLLCELFDWRNASGVKFVRREQQPIYWVTPDDRLTPTLTKAIEVNQDTLALLVKDNVTLTGEGFVSELESTKNAKPYWLPQPLPEDCLSDEDFDREVRDM